MKESIWGVGGVKGDVGKVCGEMCGRKSGGRHGKVCWGVRV